MAGGRRRLRQREAPTPLPWCIAVSGEGAGPHAALRGLGFAAPALSAAASSPSPSVARRAVRRTATAGALGYEWSGAGLLPASCDSCGRRTGAGSAAPLWWRKVDATRGPAAGKPRCQVASERPLAPSGSLGDAAPPPAALMIGPSRLHSPQSPPGAGGLVTMASCSRPR